MFSLFKRNPYRIPATRLYDALVMSARQPAFYRDYAVPDTLDGRFECISLHVFALVFRLKNEGGEFAPAADKLAQSLFDAMFRDMDYSLREMGVGDLGVPKRMKRMMKAFNGRCHAYTMALAPDAPHGALADALCRNLYGTVPQPDMNAVAAMSAYLVEMIGGMMKTPVARFLGGEVLTPVLPQLKSSTKGGDHEKAA